MSKKEKTASTKEETASEYIPIYLTINASGNQDVIDKTIAKAIEEANEYDCPLYINVNSGTPYPPPPPPPK